MITSGAVALGYFPSKSFKNNWFNKRKTSQKESHFRENSSMESLEEFGPVALENSDFENRLTNERTLSNLWPIKIPIQKTKSGTV